MSKTFFSVILSFFISGIAYAQDSIAVSALDEVVVTAGKYPRKQSETGKVITVIGRERLAQSSARSLADVLNTVAGTTIIGANANPGTNLNVSIRGSSAGNVLILIDGIPVNDPSVITNYFDLNFVNVDQVERVEILKGGQSTLYGSDAVAGVINIITRKSAFKKWGGNAELSAGSFGTIKTNLGLSGRRQSSGWGIQYGYQRTDGLSSAYDSSGSGNFDRDGLAQHTVNGHYHFALSPKLKIQLNGNLSAYKTDLDAASFKDERDFTGKNTQYQLGAAISYELEKTRLKLNYRYHDLKREYLDDSIHQSSPFVIYSESFYKGKTHFAELLLNRNTAQAEFLAGIDFRQNRMDQEGFALYSFGPAFTSLSDSLAEMLQVSTFSSLILKNKSGGSLEMGGRWNHHSEYGNNFTYTINPSWLIARRVKLFLNLYSAYKTPTLYQLFDHNYGNTDLKPERSQWIEGGVQYYPNNEWDLRMVYFKRNSKDVISFIYTDPGSFEARYVNMGKLKSSGLEAEIAYRNRKLHFSLNGAYIKGSIQSPYDEAGNKLGTDTVYSNLYRVPKYSANLVAGYSINSKWNLSATIRYVGDRPEPVYASAPFILDQYLVADLYSSYALSKKIKLYVDLRNLTDEHYFDQRGYTNKGLHVMGGLLVNF